MADLTNFQYLLHETWKAAIWHLFRPYTRQFTEFGTGEAIAP